MNWLNSTQLKQRKRLQKTSVKSKSDKFLRDDLNQTDVEF